MQQLPIAIQTRIREDLIEQIDDLVAEEIRVEDTKMFDVGEFEVSCYIHGKKTETVSGSGYDSMIEVGINYSISDIVIMSNEVEFDSSFLPLTPQS